MANENSPENPLERIIHTREEEEKNTMSVSRLLITHITDNNKNTRQVTLSFVKAPTLWLEWPKQRNVSGSRLLNAKLKTNNTRSHTADKKRQDPMVR